MKPILLLICILGMHFGTAHAQSYAPEELIIDGIECTGNTSTNCEIIQREIYLVPGQKINEDEIRNATTRLQLSGLFRNVSISLKKGTERGHVILNVEVQESNPYFSELSLSTYIQPSTSSSLYTSIKLGNRNLFGFGKILQFTLSTPVTNRSKTKWIESSLEYIDPHLFGLKKLYLTAGVSIYSYSQDVSTPPDGGNSLASLTSAYRSTSLDLGLGYRIFDFSHVGFGLNRREVAMSDRTFYSNQTFEDSDWASDFNHLNLNYGWNSEDDIYFPTEGSKLELVHIRYLPGDPLDRGSTNTNLESKINFLVSERNVLSPSLSIACFVYDHPGVICDESLSYTVGTEWAHQLRRNLFDSTVTSARFTLKPSFQHFIPGRRPINKLDAGLLFETKNLGLVRLNAFWSDQ